MPRANCSTFDEVVELAPELRRARIGGLDLPEVVRARLDAMLAVDTWAPALLNAAATEAIGRLRVDAQPRLDPRRHRRTAVCWRPILRAR